MSTVPVNNPTWRHALWIVVAVMVVAGIAWSVLRSDLAPIVRHRAIEMLRSRFGSEAPIQDLQVSVLHEISVKRSAFALHCYKASTCRRSSRSANFPAIWDG
jgi:hypothetical protein